MSRPGRRASRAEAASIFSALGDETRLLLVARLAKDGPLSIVRLSANGSISRQAITKHLTALERVGIASSCRDGRERLWRVHHERLATVQTYLQQISAQWDVALGNLRTLVEADEA